MHYIISYINFSFFVAIIKMDTILYIFLTFPFPMTMLLFLWRWEKCLSVCRDLWFCPPLSGSSSHWCSSSHCPLVAMAAGSWCSLWMIAIGSTWRCWWRNSMGGANRWPSYDRLTAGSSGRAHHTTPQSRWSWRIQSSTSAFLSRLCVMSWRDTGLVQIREMPTAPPSPFSPLCWRTDGTAQGLKLWPHAHRPWHACWYHLSEFLQPWSTVCTGWALERTISP